MKPATFVKVDFAVQVVGVVIGSSVALVGGLEGEWFLIALGVTFGGQSVRDLWKWGRR